MALTQREHYEKAKAAHEQGKALLVEIEAGKFDEAEIAEKHSQVQKWYDEVDQHTTAAKNLQQSKTFDELFSAADHAVLGKGATHEQQMTHLKGLGLPGYAEKIGLEDAEHVLAALTHLKEGPAAVQRLKIGDKAKALATQPGAAGGFLVQQVQTGLFVDLLEDLNQMRKISRVLPMIPGGSSVSPAEDSELDDAEWTSEIGTGSEDTVQPFGDRVLSPKPLAKRIRASNTLLRAATLGDVEDFINSRLGRKFSKAEENGFINGTGANQPLGLLVAPGISSISTDASNVVDGDDLIDWAYQLPSGYAANATILCNKSLIRKIRLLKDTTNQYIWQPGLAQGNPATILDWPYLISDQYPTGLDGSDVYEDNALIATIGDFDNYWIQDSLNLEIQRLSELYAETNQTGFIGRKETDGMPVRAEAFLHLKVLA